MVGTHNHEAGSSLRRRHATPFTVMSPGATTLVRNRRYVPVRNLERVIPVHLPNDWHFNPERVPVPIVLASDRAWVLEVRRHRDLLPEDLRHDPTFMEDSPLWDTWFYDEHDQHHRSSLVCARLLQRTSRRW